jgi:hypothetical protein
VQFGRLMDGVLCDPVQCPGLNPIPDRRYVHVAERARRGGDNGCAGRSSMGVRCISS